MNALLMTLTVLSLIAAAGCAWFAWRLFRDDRERSNARVQALSNAIDANDRTKHASAPVAVADLFAPEHSETARGIPVIKVAVGIAMATVLVIVVAMNNRGSSTETSADPTSTGSAINASSRSMAPLELISMRHERNGDTLTVTGLVRNPRGGKNIARVTAVVFAFNRSGAFVTSGRAALDFTTLEPGDESPFVVKIPGVADVGRYRVSFRTDAGVVRHIDRRGDQTRLASAAFTR